MNRSRISLGRILGIPIGLDFSWFLIFALVTWTLATNYFPTEFKGWPSTQYWIVGAVTALMLFVSVVLHELGHSVLALRYKIPVRSITLYIFGGVAEIGAEPPSAMAEFFIAIAGPAVSFLLAGLFRLLEPVAGAVAPVLAVARYLAYINGSLALFNLIPGFPLDGGRVFRAIIWATTGSLRRATIVAANVGRVVAFLFILFGVWQMLAGNLGNGLWIAFIGWFLESAANAQLQQQRVQTLLAGHRVAEAMSRDCPVAAASLTLQALVDHHILAKGQRCLVLQDNDRTVGLLTLHQIKDVPRDQWQTITAAQVMLNLDQSKHIRPDALLTTALEQMDHEGVNQLPVFKDDQLTGILSREDLISYLRTLHDLSR